MFTSLRVASVRLVIMENDPPRRSSPLSQFILEEVVELLFSDQWIDSDRLTAAVNANLPESCKTGEVNDWICNRVDEKLRHWVDRGLIEELGGQYRALEGLGEVKAHLAASHCGELLNMVRRPIQGTRNL